ncbi:MAG: ribulose-phosphate 3-epimerase [Deltaproteobacteria bacterium]|nr:ribulose-phosphate 3-epimerase [Deltaproteobacteria bacterium]
MKDASVKPKLAPSLLSADFGNLEAEIAQLNPQYADYLHLDIMDGHFVPNITIGPMVVNAVSKLTQIPLDVHLMIEHPDRYITDFIRAGANVVTVHAEACAHLQRTLQFIRQQGAKAGVSLNPATGLDVLDHILPDIDLILLMTVNPGFGGQKFIPQMMEKIKDCAHRIKGSSIELEVDGGVKLDNIRELYDAGARVFVSGSGIFGHPPYNDMMKKMRAKIGLSE